uniref:Uncharacterized protein n=1 Tax=Gossypium raimondii TaxID=29730 RepID=A0A0D2TZ53_GOSRA|nr:hypothetical protein B456_013G110100 [Gossypium raimondii]
MQNCSCYQNLSYDISCYYSRTRSRSVSIKSSIKVYFDEHPRWRYPFHDLTTSDQIAHRAQPNNLRWNRELSLKTQVSH